MKENNQVAIFIPNLYSATKKTGMSLELALPTQKVLIQMTL